MVAKGSASAKHLSDALGMVFSWLRGDSHPERKQSAKQWLCRSGTSKQLIRSVWRRWARWLRSGVILLE